jgi:pimeloyl-ACP methyl ester carboxylesterase
MGTMTDHFWTIHGSPMPCSTRRNRARTVVIGVILVLLGGLVPAPAFATGDTVVLPPARQSFAIGAGGAKISIKEYGPGADEAPTIVLVHGWPDNSDVWNKVIPFLLPKYHVVNYDPRGSGLSDHPKAVYDYALPLLSQDFEAVINATAPGKKVHILAHDWGGTQTWESAARIPDRFSSFTVISGESLDFLGPHVVPQLLSPPAWPGLSVQAIASSYVFFNKLPFLPEVAWRTGIAEQAIRMVFAAQGAEREAYSPEDGISQTNLYRANIPDKILFPTYSRVDVPVVQRITPTQDKFVTPALNVPLEQRVRSLWERTVDTDHWAPLIAPEKIALFTSQLVEFREHGIAAPAGVVVK